MDIREARVGMRVKYTSDVDYVGAPQPGAIGVIESIDKFHGTDKSRGGGGFVLVRWDKPTPGRGIEWYYALRVTPYPILYGGGF